MHSISLPTSIRSLLRASAVVALAALLAGCMNTTASRSLDSNVANANASLPAPTGATIAFDSVDGPPPHLFDRYVEMMDSEAKLRSVAVVSHKDSAAFRVRTYLAAIVDGKKTSIAWVWDVYDRDQNRTIRLRGEEKTDRAGSDAWAMADDVVLRRIAQAGFTGLRGVTGGEDAPAPAEPAQGTPAQASADAAPTVDNRQVAIAQASVATR